MSHATGRMSRRDLALLSFAALGVVYGDIGTSPLYAFEECFSGPYGVPVTHDNVLGVLSLIFWSLNFVVSFKYISIVLRADNRGEGGILALLALTGRSGTSKGIGLVMGVGLFGAALLYGDGIITPAISVLGAVEGLETLTPALRTWVVPIAVVIITALFFVQRRGTARVGAIFGPVTTLWFISIAILGVMGIMREPAVLAAVNPMYAARFLATGGWDAFEVLAAVVLVVTGGEALYADMGHFGPRPIRIAWYSVVLPALVLNYFGQGALLLQDPTAATGPFYALVPRWALIPMIAIATAAAVVASQALISGAYSLTQQAMQLGFSPRLRIVHTSEATKGQIYMPEINTALWVACIGLVLSFRSAGALASTYGVAVTGTMFVTSILFMIVARERWHWPRWRVAVLGALFLIVDLSFLAANLLKIPSGGWFPLVVAGMVFVLMSTWKLGRKRLSSIVAENTLPFEMFLPDLGRRNLPRVPGTAVFMTSVPSGAPPVLLHHLKHNKVLHERVLVMSVSSADIPQVSDDERITCEPLGQGFYLVKARYGFMETPDVPKVLALLPGELQEQGHQTGAFKMQDTSFYLGRETLIVSKKALKADAKFFRMMRWRRTLFALMSRNAQSATAFFQLPPNRVVELGAQIQF